MKMNPETRVVIGRWQKNGYTIVRLGRQIFAVKGKQVTLLYVGGDLVVTVAEEKRAALA